MDLDADWLYFLASPDDPVRQYLYRARLDGSGKPERVTPQASQGWNRYDIAPGGKFALHAFSTFNSPPHGELISLPDHKVIRTLIKIPVVLTKHGLHLQDAETVVRSSPAFLANFKDNPVLWAFLNRFDVFGRGTDGLLYQIWQ